MEFHPSFYDAITVFFGTMGVGGALALLGYVIYAFVAKCRRRNEPTRRENDA